MKEARFYEKVDAGKGRCFLCAHHCIIAPGKRGICAVRENIDGTLYGFVYGKVIAKHIDPIEKKPLFHFYPGSRSYSIATVGCNFRCLHCQNYDISQYPKSTIMAFPGAAPPQPAIGVCLGVRHRQGTGQTPLEHQKGEPIRPFYPS